MWRAFTVFVSWVVFLVGLSITSKAQTKESDSLRFSSIIIGSDYSTNTNTFGKFNSFVKQPSLAPYISFTHKNGLLFSGLVNIVANSDSASTRSTYQVNLKAGYQFNFTPDISLTPSYTRYVYDENTVTINTLYKNYAEANLAIQKTYWNSALSAGYLWGLIEEFSIDARVGGSYSWDGVLFKNDALLVQGVLSGFFNNPNYLSKVFYFLDDYAEANPTAKRNDLAWDLVQRFPGTIVREIRQIMKNDQVLRYMARDYIPADITIKDFLNNNNKFTLTSLAVSLPITYLIGDFSVNIECSYYRMLNQPVYFTEKNYFYFTAGVSYSFDWD